MDTVTPHNPYALAQWSRDLRGPLPWEPVKTRAPVMQLRARHRTGSWWKRFDKRYLQKKNAVVVFSALKESQAAGTVFRLGLTQPDLRKLKDRFDLIDADESGQIDYGEFLHMMGCRRSAYTDALFRSVDVDNSQSVSLAELVQMLGDFLTLDERGLFLFVMRMFDVNHEGGIEEEEYRLLRHSVVRKARRRLPRRWEHVLRDFDADEDGSLCEQEFMALTRKHPLVVAPAARLQDRLRRATLGRRRWKNILRDLDVRKNMVAYMVANGGQPPPRQGSLLLRAVLCFLPRSCGDDARRDREARDRILMSKLNWSGLHDVQKTHFIESTRAVGLYRPSSVALTATMQRELGKAAKQAEAERLNMQEEKDRAAKRAEAEYLSQQAEQHSSGAPRKGGAKVVPSR